jgi:TonB-linked SusC/RagA family outer membrane protein
MDHLLLFNHKFGAKHTINGTAGVTLNHGMRLMDRAIGMNYLDNLHEANAMNMVPTLDYEASTRTEYTYFSFLGRANYNFDNRFLLTATFRGDQSSKFQPGKQWGYFPSFSAAYNLHNEAFMQNISFLSRLKVRAGWGQVGNSASPVHATINTYTYSKGADPDGIEIMTIVPATKGNPDLTWETSQQTNFGLDLGFLNNRLMATVDVYKKLTKDQLQNVQLPGTAGFSSQWQNLGEVENKGLELELNGHALKRSDLNIYLGGNISFNRNKVVNLGLEPDDLGWVMYLGGRVNAGWMAEPINAFIEGQPVGVFWGYQTKGIIQEGEEGDAPTFSALDLAPGDIYYVDLNGDADDITQPDGDITTLDRTIIGDPNPDFTYGLFGDLSYKDLTLSFLFTGSYGGDVFNANIHELLKGTVQAPGGVYTPSYLESWTPENRSNRWPRIGREDATYNYVFHDMDLQDGSYLKLGQVTVGYTFRFSNLFLEKIKLYVTGQNLLYITGYEGWSPEVGYNNYRQHYGIDYNRFPAPRTFLFGVNLGF